MAKEKSKEKKKTERQKSKDLVGTRGRTFEGIVIRKFPKRITIEFERTVYLPKYERYMKKKTRIHARLPEDMEVNLDDMAKVRECRPLSKTIHFMVVGIVKKAESEENVK